ARRDRPDRSTRWPADWYRGSGRWIGGFGRMGPLRLSGGDRQVVLPELEQVMGRGDQSPFGPARPQASSLEPVDPSVVFGLREHGLDDRLSLPVELFAFLGG